MLDVTIVYPAGPPTFWCFLSGRVPEIIVDVRERVIPPEFLRGDYKEDTVFRAEFQQWVASMWAAKDLLIDRMLQQAARRNRAC
jgi:hypothetical protein